MSKESLNSTLFEKFDLRVWPPLLTKTTHKLSLCHYQNSLRA